MQSNAQILKCAILPISSELGQDKKSWSQLGAKSDEEIKKQEQEASQKAGSKN